MPYELNNPALIEIQIIGRLHGQTTRNVFHYAKTDAVPVPDGNSELTSVMATFEVNVLPAYLDFASNEYQCRHIYGQVIYPTRFRARFQVPAVTTGGVAGSSLPSGCAAVISTYSIHAGKPYRGRKFFAGIPVTTEQDSLINAAGLVTLDILRTKMLMSMTGTQVNWKPWVGKANPTLDPVFNEQYIIVDTTVRDTIRYQRRRTVGVGE